MTPLEERAKKGQKKILQRGLVDFQQFKTFVEDNIFLSQIEIKEQN